MAATTADQAAFNLPGPDLDGGRLRGAARQDPSARIVFVNTASSSGEFVKALAGPARTIVTATRTGGERNETRFPAFFVEAFTGDGADRDRNGRISVQEAFDYARAKVQQAFEREGYILQRARDARRRRQPAAGRQRSIWSRSGRAPPSSPARPIPRCAPRSRRQRQLEDQIAGLRLRKPSMPADEYDKELEKLVTALALKSRAIQQLEGKK